MTVSYDLGFEPLWYISDLNGTAAGDAHLYSWRSLDKAEPKPIYTDPAGQYPFTNPIIFDANGVAPGPLYFKEDSTNTDETYFLQVYNGDRNTGGVLLWEVDGYLPSTGGGGGSDVTEVLPLVNYIANNQFINHTTTQTTTSLTSLVVAPSNHQGFTPYIAANPLIGTYGALGPDIMFLKNSTANTDSITFPAFTFGGSELTPDVTPPRYLNYTCSTSNAGETYKCFQFPITQNVQNLSNQDMTFRIWAKATSGTPDIKLYTRQYYGSGTGATAESSSTRQLIDTITLSTSWTSYVSTFTMPNVSGKTLGTPGLTTNDDAVYLQLQVPLNTACGILFTKPLLFLGSVSPTTEFDNYDQINSIDSTARCGDVKVGYLATAPLGWLLMNDTSIGNTGSGATNAGDYTFQLYTTIYTAVIDTWAPVSGGRSGGGNTVANAITDFLAGKTLTLPLALGRAMANFGTATGVTAPTAWVLGQNAGEQKHLMALDELVQHTHNPVVGSTAYIMGGTSSTGDAPSGGSLGSKSTTGGVTSATVPNNAFNVVQPTSFMNFYIKL